MALPKTHTPFLFEIFEAFELAQTDAQRIEILRKNSGFELNTLLATNFRPTIVFDLPPGAPPFKRDDGDPDESLTRVKSAMSDLPSLLKTSKIDSTRKETRFIGILESIHCREADLIILMKDKQLSMRYPTLTPQIVKLAIPGVFA